MAQDIRKRGEFLEELKEILLLLQDVDKELAFLEYTHRIAQEGKVISVFEEAKIRMDSLINSIKLRKDE